MKRVLVLGAGLVARPLVRTLLDKGYHLIVADQVQAKAEQLVAGHAQGEARPFDAANDAAVGELVAEADLAVSLLPYTFHPIVARHCLARGKHLVTASYVSDAMQALDADARAAGLTFLNEIGLDPGIDHMSAMKIIDDVKRRGGRVEAFRSYCGGLPDAADNDNPFGYKFSWAPRGVLLAGRNNAVYRLDGAEVKVPNWRLFRDEHMLYVEDAGFYEAYPNRDSISYIEAYGLEGIDTMYRGTLRYPGWCDTLQCMNTLGLLSLDELDGTGLTCATLMRRLAAAAPGEDLVRALARKLVIPQEAAPIHNMRWLGLLSERPLPAQTTTPLDVLAMLMQEKLVYAPKERDLVVMFHDFRVRFPDGRRERITSKLIDRGLPGGDSSMARTVSLPAAIGADLILSGRLTRRGVLRPVTPDVYEPALAELATHGIRMVETTVG